MKSSESTSSRLESQHKVCDLILSTKNYTEVQFFKNENRLRQINILIILAVLGFFLLFENLHTLRPTVI